MLIRYRVDVVQYFKDRMMTFIDGMTPGEMAVCAAYLMAQLVVNRPGIAATIFQGAYDNFRVAAANLIQQFIAQNGPQAPGAMIIVFPEIVGWNGERPNQALYFQKPESKLVV